jgi:hypothetical protein
MKETSEEGMLPGIRRIISKWKKSIQHHIYTPMMKIRNMWNKQTKKKPDKTEKENWQIYNDGEIPTFLAKIKQVDITSIKL